jgi:ABC-type branched-subunit amino acid transport system substrate-binding protein
MNVPFMSGDGAIDPKFIEIAGGKSAEGTFLTFGPDARNFAEAKAFVDKYTARFGEIGPYSNYAYDAALVLLTAIREAQSTEGKSLAEKLHSIEFSGSMGKIRFTDKGDVAVAPYVVWITRNGKFVEHWKP